LLSFSSQHISVQQREVSYIIALFFGSADQTKLQCASPAPPQHGISAKIKTLCLFLIERY